MRIDKIRNVLQEGESLTVEFKESKSKLNKDVFESVCAFLNRNGGELLLGVKDNGDIVGIDEASIDKIKKNFVTSMNNPQKISPTFYLSIEEIKIDVHTILYIYVPESSQVHRCNGKIFDRNEDEDFEITDNTNLVAEMYMRKQRNLRNFKELPRNFQGTSRNLRNFKELQGTSKELPRNFTRNFQGTSGASHLTC